MEQSISDAVDRKTSPETAIESCCSETHPDQTRAGKDQRLGGTTSTCQVKSRAQQSRLKTKWKQAQLLAVRNLFRVFTAIGEGDRETGLERTKDL